MTARRTVEVEPLAAADTSVVASLLAVEVDDSSLAAAVVLVASDLNHGQVTSASGRKAMDLLDS